MTNCHVSEVADCLARPECSSLVRAITFTVFSLVHLAGQVVSFAGELLGAAEALLRDGLHTSEVADGYGKAAAKVQPLFSILVMEQTVKTAPISLL